MSLTSSRKDVCANTHSKLKTQNSLFPQTHEPGKENTFSRACNCRNTFLLMLQHSQGDIWSSEFSVSACCHHSNHKPKVRHLPDDATLALWSRRHAEDWHNPAASAASSSSEVQPVTFQTSALSLIMTYFLKLVEMRTQYLNHRKWWLWHACINVSSRLAPQEDAALPGPLAYCESRKGLNKQSIQAGALGLDVLGWRSSSGRELLQPPREGKRKAAWRSWSMPQCSFGSRKELQQGQNGCKTAATMTRFLHRWNKSHKNDGGSMLLCSLRSADGRSEHFDEAPGVRGHYWLRSITAEDHQEPVLLNQWCVYIFKKKDLWMRSWWAHTPIYWK